jgi:hypothetical protein
LFADKRLILLFLPNIITSHFLKMFYNDWYNIHRDLLCTLFINWFRFYVLGVMFLWVGGYVFLCWGSCICVLGVMYLCVGVMYLCVGVMHLYAGCHVFVCWYMTPNTQMHDPQHINTWPQHTNTWPPTHKYMTPNT